jgi:hypothetical protein
LKLKFAQLNIVTEDIKALFDQPITAKNSHQITGKIETQQLVSANWSGKTESRKCYRLLVFLKKGTTCICLGD